MNNGKHGQGTHSTEMGADSSAENTPNASKNISPKCLPKPKSSRFLKKSSLWESVVHAITQKTNNGHTNKVGCWYFLINFSLKSRSFSMSFLWPRDFKAEKKSNFLIRFYILCLLLAFFSMSNGVFQCKTGYRSPLMHGLLNTNELNSGISPRRATI